MQFIRSLRPFIIVEIFNVLVEVVEDLLRVAKCEIVTSQQKQVAVILVENLLRADVAVEQASVVRHIVIG